MLSCPLGEGVTVFNLINCLLLHEQYWRRHTSNTEIDMFGTEKKMLYVPRAALFFKINIEYDSKCFLLNKVSQCSPECIETGMPQQSTMRKQKKRLLSFFPPRVEICVLSFCLTSPYRTPIHDLGKAGGMNWS